MTFGSRAAGTHEPRQVREEAAVSGASRVPRECLNRANCSGNARKVLFEGRCTAIKIAGKSGLEGPLFLCLAPSRYLCLTKDAPGCPRFASDTPVPSALGFAVNGGKSGPVKPCVAHGPLAQLPVSIRLPLTASRQLRCGGWGSLAPARAKLFPSSAAPLANIVVTATRKTGPERRIPQCLLFKGRCTILELCGKVVL